MSTTRIAARVATFVLYTVTGLAVSSPSPAFAAAKDYRFELVGSPAQSGKATVIKVRLVHVPDGKPVPGAIILQTQLDMAPQGMPSMTAPAKASATAVDGVSQIEAEPAMAGNWALTLSAKVQGERETVSGTVTVPIAK